MLRNTKIEGLRFCPSHHQISQRKHPEGTSISANLNNG
jgi:hypothetical protein